MVRVDAAATAPGIMFAGAKLQLNALGRLGHESAIGLSNEPDCGVAVIVKLPDLPAEMFMLAGAAPKDKVGVPLPEPPEPPELDPPHAGL